MSSAVVLVDQAPKTHLRIAAICERFGITRQTWRMWVVSQQAPQPIPNLPGHPRWAVDDIERFARGRFVR